MLSYSDFLLTVDFDRTLTAPDVTIPRANLDAIRRFMALGGSFTLNTGRSIPMFRDYLDTIPHNAPMLLYNGAAWYEGGKLTHCRTIGADWKEMVKEILSVFPELTMEIQGINAHYVFRPNPNWEKFCLAQHSIPFRPEMCRHGSYTVESGYNAVLELERSGISYSAILAANDLMALGALKAVREFGYRVPEDVQIIGFDNIEFSQYCEPSLSTMQQPTFDMGAKAVELLTGIIEKRDPVQPERLIPKLLMRKTTR